MNSTDTLDGFESKLLAELKTVVADTAAATEVASRPMLGRRVLAVAAAASLVAVGAAAVAVTRPTPAYAVGDTGDAITVQVNRLADAQALQADLAKLGIKADVSYTAPGFACAPGRYTPSTKAMPGPLTMRAETDSSGRQTLTVPKALLGQGETLVLTSTWFSPESWALGAGIADGPVAPCDAKKADGSAPFAPDRTAPTGGAMTPGR